MANPYTFRLVKGSELTWEELDANFSGSIYSASLEGNTLTFTTGDESTYSIDLNTTEGSQGPQGPQGLVGPQGNQGRQGLKGDQGDQGPTGPQGNQGRQGLKGDQGDQGPTGPQGNQGNQGLKGDQGDQGPTGPQGNQGNQGLKGDQGDQGPTGPQGNQGNQGLKGDQGDQGSIGPQGNQGNQGLKGDQGDQGPIGPQGDQGPIGPQGNQGLKGDQGDQGPIGPQGNQGNQGFQGPIGPQGNQGLKGDQGDQGPTGPQGNQGNQGFQGPATGVTINNNTDNYVITATGTANTLNGEANMTFDGNNLKVTHSVFIQGTAGEGGTGGLHLNTASLYYNSIVTPGVSTTNTLTDLVITNFDTLATYSFANPDLETGRIFILRNWNTPYSATVGELYVTSSLPSTVFGLLGNPSASLSFTMTGSSAITLMFVSGGYSVGGDGGFTADLLVQISGDRIGSGQINDANVADLIG